jgi:hypothetical protein
VADPKRFAIQREDASWYQGRSDDGSPVWTPDVQSARTFDSYVEALEILKSLQQAGYQVRLFGIP